MLLAEDDANDELFVRRAVEHVAAKVVVMTVPNGEDAIAYLTGTPPYDDRNLYPFPNLVVLDLKMPRKTGLELLLWMQENPGVVNVPVVVLSGSIFKEEHQEALRLGAAGFFSKTTDYNELKETVRQLITRFLPHAGGAETRSAAGA